MSNVEITIKAIADKAISDIKKAGGAIEGLDNSAKKGEKGISGFSLSMLGLDSALNVVNKVMQAGSKIYDSLIIKTINYAEQVDKLSRDLGINAEEASKLIQMTDDVFISQEALTTAMRGAIQNGIDPSIEGLKNLSDKYLAIKDPIESSKFLMDTFGKSGLEMGKLLEQGAGGIDALATSAEESGLVMSENGVNAAFEYKESLDKLNDSLDSMVYNLGSRLLPALTDILLPIAEAIDLVNKERTARELLVEKLALNATSYEDFTQKVIENKDALDLSSSSQAGWLGLVDESILATSAYTEEFYNNTIAQQANETSTRGLKTANDELQAAYGGVAAAQKELEATQQGWLTSTAGEINSQLKDMGTNSEGYRLALVEIDKAMGTDLESKNEQSIAIKAMTDAYKNTGDIEGFKNSLAGLKDTYLPETTEKLDLAYESVDKLEKRVADLQHTAENAINIKVNFVTSGDAGDIFNGSLAPAGNP